MGKEVNICGEVNGENGKGIEGKKRGRKAKNVKREYQINQEQTKFFVDLSKEEDVLRKVFSILSEANQKEYGREIAFKDLALFSIDKITAKDIEKIKESSLSEMEKVERALEEHNKKNKTNLTLGEFLVKKLAIN